MYKIRLISYSQNTVAVQVYTIENRKRKIVRHIGTAKNEEEKAKLIQLAYDFIEKISSNPFCLKIKIPVKSLTFHRRNLLVFTTLFSTIYFTGYLSILD